MAMKLKNRAGLASAGLAVLVAVSGCSQARRVPTGETTRDELNDKRQLPVSFAEFEQGAVADLLQEVPVMRRVSDTAGGVTILLGDINNKTGITSTSDYEFVMSGIRSRLIRAQATREKLHFVEKRRRVEDLAIQERVATAPAQGDAQSEEIRWGGGSYYVPDYDADRTYGLFMDVYRVGRGDTNLYRMELQVVSLATNDILYSYSRDTKQVSD